MRGVVALGLLLAVASVAVPLAFGIRLHLAGLLQAVLGSTLLVGCSALALNGSRPVALSARRAVPAVLATTAANAVTPAGIGGNLMMLRIHRKSGLSAEQAAAAAGLRTGVGALCATAITAITASTVGMDQLPSNDTTIRLAVAFVCLVGLATVFMHKTRRRIVESAGRFTQAVWDVVRQPRCAASLVVGCVGVTAAQLITLQGAVHAVGGHIELDALLVTLLGSAAARSAVPSPGGVGPIEAALVAGLTALGMQWETAVTAVAVYRTAGHWLPVVAGVVSLGQLRRKHLI
ncbi:MAG: hypothetical protein JWO22_1509 [Frankiales bacterium]|nr:hypothetical protein [Frankiales bacterium]